MTTGNGLQREEDRVGMGISWGLINPGISAYHYRLLKESTSHFATAALGVRHLLKLHVAQFN